MLKRLQDALLEAFPTRHALARMIRFGLDEHLDAIAGGDNLTDLTFNLLRWAENRDLLDLLIDAALRENTGNPRLRAVAEELGHATVPAERASVDQSQHTQNRNLVDALLDLPEAATFEGRTALLGSVRGPALRRHRSDARLDVEGIVRQLMSRGADAALRALAAHTQSDDTPAASTAPRPPSIESLLAPRASPAYLFYVSRDRISALFQQVEPEVLAVVAAHRRPLLPYGEPGAHVGGEGERATIVRQLDAVLQRLASTATIADLNRVVSERGRLDAPWYEVRADFSAEGWDPARPGVPLTACLGDYRLELTCSKRNLAGIVEERGNLLPTSTSALLFDGRSTLALRGVVRLAAVERATKTLRGTPLFLVLEPLVEQL